ncbi:MAG: hypothetical protein M3461_24125 [Pseudomonadota bacterium]|nr:hypothetical protein [Pseudomonadota bacterium]
MQGLEIERQKDSVLLDAASRRNLEIDTALSGARDHSLIGLMDTAVTAMGGRWLRRWVQRPIRHRHHLGLRHHAVGARSRGATMRGYASACGLSAIWSGCWRALRYAPPDRATSRSFGRRSAPCPSCTAPDAECSQN